MRYNGTLKFQAVTHSVKDTNTGFYVQGSETEFSEAVECQIDKNTPAKRMIGEDGQEFSYSYNVYVPKDTDTTGLSVGSRVIIFDVDGNKIDEFDALGVDDLNNKYVEIWG